MSSKYSQNEIENQCEKGLAAGKQLYCAFRVAVARVYIERLRSSFEMEHRLRSSEAAQDRTGGGRKNDALLYAFIITG